VKVSGVVEDAEEARVEATRTVVGVIVYLVTGKEAQQLYL
jgi:hypothetical protein